MTPEERQRFDDLEQAFEDFHRFLDVPYGTRGQIRLLNLPGSPNVGVPGALAVINGALCIYTSGVWVPVGLAGQSTYTVYASGTAYSLTTSFALLNFGTTDPQVALVIAGTYLLLARVRVQYNGATFAANRFVQLKLRKSSGTPADISNANTTIETGVVTTITSSLGTVSLAPVFYVATAGDVIDLQGLVTVAPSAGSVDCVEAEIVALRIA